MKTASLDQHRGYAQEHYDEVKQFRTTEYVPKTLAAGYQLLRDPLWNKGESSPTYTHESVIGSVDHATVWHCRGAAAPLVNAPLHSTFATLIHIFKQASPSHQRSVCPKISPDCCLMSWRASRRRPSGP